MHLPYCGKDLESKKRVVGILEHVCWVTPSNTGAICPRRSSRAAIGPRIPQLSVHWEAGQRRPRRVDVVIETNVLIFLDHI